MAWPQGSTQYLIKKVATGQKLSKDLTEDESYEILKRILAGETTPAQTGAFFAAMRMKGESGEELAGFTRAVREKSISIAPKAPYLVDVGYPYDGKTRTDILIVGAAFIAAAAGVSILLHGARHVPPKRGRAPEELLERLGIPVDLAPSAVETFLQKTGIGYLSCHHFSRPLADLLEIPAEIGVRSCLSAVHKLMNPAQAPVTVLGITHPPYLKSMSKALCLLEVRKGWVIQGIEGAPELSLGRATPMVAIQGGRCEDAVMDPRSLGLPEIKDSEWKQRPLDENANMTLRALEGEPSPWRELFLWNAAFLIFASGKVGSVQEGWTQAREALDQKGAMRVLERAKICVAA